MDKLTIKNLDLYYYGNLQALKNINLNIPEKEITAFIGPSGCGKSTLLKSLNRMNDLVEGCRIDGRDPSGRRGYLQGYGCEPAPETGGHGFPEAKSIPHEHL